MENKTYQLSFQGKGGELFGIWIVNMLLQMITLGFYYPWAKANMLQYLYSNTELEGDRFQFSGTGKEMFIGFIKAFAIVFVLYGTFFLMIYLQMPVVGAIIFFAGFMMIIPLAIHGSFRYRMSRTSWRGIRFGYRGNRNELIKLFITGFFLTLITFGIYGSWFVISIRNYVLSQVRMGNGKFTYRGNGTDFFVLNLVGYLLTLVTLGIYAFWWQKNLFEYYVNNLHFENGEQNIRFKSKATGGGFFSLLVGNILMIIFTLGLAFPWVMVRSLKFVFNNIDIEGDVELESLRQTEESYKDALGDDMADFFDLDLVL